MVPECQEVQFKYQLSNVKMFTVAVSMGNLYMTSDVHGSAFLSLILAQRQPTAFKILEPISLLIYLLFCTNANNVIMHVMSSMRMKQTK